MTDALRVLPASGRRDRRAFLTLPYRLYRGHPVWVPPLRMMERTTQDPKRNPFFAHGEAQHFLARRGRRVVGRIAAIENRRHNEYHDDKTGFFGFFDVEDDPDAATALVDAARRWIESRGLSPMRGPVCYSTNEVCGVLVDGFEDPPAILMPYNRPDYDALLRGAGLRPAKDLLAYWVPADTDVPERFRRVVTRRMERGHFRLRPIDLKQMDREVDVLLDVYNRCWERNWGFVPATDTEFRAMARDMKMVLEPDLSAVAERDGEAVGFSLILRDLNRLLRGTGGRLFPWGLPRILWGLKRVGHTRIIALGVVPEARGGAVAEAFFMRAMDNARKKGHVGGEAGWILEENEKMRAPLDAVGARPFKRYRLYESA
ncbi:MAG: N-acetyltransferase [Planctomycetota bacterium]|jgi:GNAT superfamily N-acetyltransferase